MTTSAQIKSTLESKLIGKKYSPFVIENDLAKAVRPLFLKNGLSENDILINYQFNESHKIGFSHKGQTIGFISFTTECISEDNCVFKSFDVELNFDSVEKAIENVEKTIAAEEDERKNECGKLELEAEDALKLIMEKAGSLSKAFTICEYISHHTMEYCSKLS